MAQGRGTGPNPPRPGRVGRRAERRHSRPSSFAVAAGIVLIVAGLAALAARIIFVRWGILYGTAAVSHVDAIVGALVVVGLALMAWGWSSKRAAQAARTRQAAGAAQDANPDPSPGSRWTDWASGVTALAGTAALVVSLMNLLEPLTPPRFTTAACPGANLNEVPYVGITAGLNGDNSRAGPARAYLPDGRFPAGCSVGFDVYCLGDPIEDQTGSTNQETWVTSRWLRVAKQPRGWRSAMAHVLSGENTQPQFISDEFVTPESAYSDLPYGNRSCPGRFPLPGRTQLQRFDAKADTFTADATDATNMGFAVYVPPGQGFRNGGTYLQIYNPAGTKNQLARAACEAST